MREEKFIIKILDQNEILYKIIKLILKEEEYK